MSVNPNQEKYEFIAVNWGKLPIEKIAKHTKFEELYIHTIIHRMRQRGIPIPKISKRSRINSKRFGSNIDYEKIKQLIQASNV